MELFNYASVFTAFIRPEQGANVGIIRTSGGSILIDTASSPGEIRALFDMIDEPMAIVHLVINTHFHTDHTWGNQHFSCPILAHRLCLEKMQANLQGEWSQVALHQYLADLEKTDPPKAEEFRPTLQELKIKLPDQVYECEYEGELGGVRYRVIHLGGHSPDSSIVWLPAVRLLYASDLIFQGRYPYIFDSDIPAWSEALKRLLEFQADVIIPGHGSRVTGADITHLCDYLEQTWQLTEQHIRMGHSVEETCADPRYPVFAAGKKEKLHLANIRYMYMKLSE